MDSRKIQFQGSKIRKINSRRSRQDSRDQTTLRRLSYAIVAAYDDAPARRNMAKTGPK